jgi:hypothetical protein
MSRLRKVAKAVQGTDKVIVRSDGTGLRKLQCPRCSKQVARSLDNQGKPIYKCICGASFRSVTM